MAAVKSSLPGNEKSLYRDHDNNYLTGKDMENPNLPLFALQKDVERLPVPKLEETLDLYLQSILPLVSPQEYTETVKKTEEFRRTIGPVLQQRLEARAAEKSNTSWFQEWWNEYAYLGYRDSVVYNVSYYLQFADEPIFAMNPTRRAARFVSHALKIRDLVTKGQLKPDMRSDGKPMENSQWKFVFNTCRMPAQPMDFVRTYAADVFQHIVVARNNRFFELSLVDPQTGKYLNVDQFEASFNRIVTLADSLGVEPNAVGILTAEDRDVWFKKRQLLCEIKENEKVLERIQSSAFMVCFDPQAPVTREETGRALLHSDGKSRWWDKSFQLVFFANGKAGYVGEHSMTDGLTTTRFVNETLDAFMEDSEITKFPNPDSGNDLALLLNDPKPLNFLVNNKIKAAIAEACVTFDEIISTKELKVLMIHGFGKNDIKKLKCSPDAFTQVAMQLAYFKTFGVCRATYESTQTRSYMHGRTEVTRSCTSESLKFARAMSIVPKDHPAELYSKTCYGLMMKAISAHSSYIGKASKAHGCDRHLLGLKLLLKDGENAAFFNDVSYKRSCHWAVSTSGLVGENMDGWGFGEVVPDGIGIGYSVQDERLRFTVTSRHKWAEHFLANLEMAIVEMKTLGKAFATTTPSKL